MLRRAVLIRPAWVGRRHASEGQERGSQCSKAALPSRLDNELWIEQRRRLTGRSERRLLFGDMQPSGDGRLTSSRCKSGAQP
jgi:hypothetical protein